MGNVIRTLRSWVTKQVESGSRRGKLHQLRFRRDPDCPTFEGWTAKPNPWGAASRTHPYKACNVHDALLHHLWVLNQSGLICGKNWARLILGYGLFELAWLSTFFECWACSTTAHNKIVQMLSISYTCYYIVIKPWYSVYEPPNTYM